MKLRSIATLLGSATFLAVFIWPAFAQSEPGQASPSALQATGPMGGRGMMAGGGTTGDHAMMTGPGGRTANQMRMWGMTPPMMNQGRMLMHAVLARDDPAVLLGLRDQLSLTAAQTARLQAIASQARQDTRGVLTDAQRHQLDRLPSTSGSMAQMYGQMLALRQHMRDGNVAGAASSSPTPCRMMQMMMTMPVRDRSSGGQ